jgi:hypothetical protein
MGLKSQQMDVVTPTRGKETSIRKKDVSLGHYGRPIPMEVFPFHLEIGP